MNDEKKYSVYNPAWHVDLVVDLAGTFEAPAVTSSSGQSLTTPQYTSDGKLFAAHRSM